MSSYMSTFSGTLNWARVSTSLRFLAMKMLVAFCQMGHVVRVFYCIGTLWCYDKSHRDGRTSG